MKPKGMDVILGARVKISLFVSVAMFGFSPHAGAESIKPLPLFPASPDPPALIERIQLGRKLFFDRRLSGDGSMSCAVCHNPATGYSDGLAISRGYPTTGNRRNTPTLINSGHNTAFFWDGRASTLEEQALVHIMSAFEMNQNLDYLEEELKEVPAYVEAFQKVFGGEITRERTATALAAFQRTLLSYNAPIDRFLSGDKGALTALEKKGYMIFTGKGGCVTCHCGPNLTDNGFHNLGVPENPDLADDPRVAATLRFTAKVSGYKAYRTLTEDPGRYLVTKDRKDWKAFKTPILRETAVTAPYMHNGVFASIEKVIEFFDEGGGDGPNKARALKPLNLTPDEKKALKAFLFTALQGDLVVVRPPKSP